MNGVGDARDTDWRVIRRALVAGGAVAAVIAATLLVGVVIVGAGGAVGMAAVLGALTLGSLVAAAWLLLSVLFDLLAGRSPGPRRLWWGLGLGMVAFIAPVFVLGALSAAAS